MNVQLALQGGGARIVDLLAVADVFQEYQKTSRLSINRVAGTSAGAIVGAFLAAGIDISRIREDLRKADGAQLLNSYTFPVGRFRVIKRLWNLLDGKPIWDTQALEDWLYGIFDRHNCTNVADINKRGTQLTIVASNLRNRNAEIQSPEQDIVTALVNSAGLPFLFRTWNASSNAVIVDGGICENLPTDQLLGDEATNGPIIAVTFHKTRSKAPNSLPAFSLALLDTAISHGVARSVKSLSQDAVLEIKTDLGTFDFSDAIAYLGDHYDLVRSYTRDWLDKYLARKDRKRTLALDDPWKDSNQTAKQLMLDVWEMYEKQHLGIPIKYNRVTHSVICYEAFRADQEYHHHPDIFRTELEFDAYDGNSPVSALGIGFIGGKHFSFYRSKASIRIMDASRKEVTVNVIPMKRPGVDSRRDVLVCFWPMLTSENGPYRVIYEEHGHGFMRDLLTRGSDAIEFAPMRAKSPLPLVQLVLQISKERRDVYFGRKATDAYTTEQSRSMTTTELADFVPPCDEFRTLGWVGRNIAPNDDNWGVMVLGDPPG